MTLVRKETKRGHSYTLDGEPVKGVTTLIGAGFPKPALANWASRTVAEYVADNESNIEQLRTMGREPMVSALKAVPWQARDAAAVRGTEVHAIAEELIHGREVDVPDALVAYVQGYVDWLEAFQVEPVLTERVCASRNMWYAGTFDAIVRMGAGEHAGQTLLLDWKTSKGVYGETAMQLAAYAYADFFLDDDGSEQKLPEVDGMGIVHITPNGTNLHMVVNPAAAWAMFKHVAYVAKNADVVKALLSDPIETPLAVTA